MEHVVLAAVALIDNRRNIFIYSFVFVKLCIHAFTAHSFTSLSIYIYMCIKNKHASSL